MAKYKFNTHYDNLNVARNSPSEVIRAAYRALSQKYHPDKYHDHREADRIMTLINAAYAVLSDPDQRRQHDEWITQQEEKAGEEKRQAETIHVPFDDAARFTNHNASPSPNPNSIGVTLLLFSWFLSLISILMAIPMLAAAKLFSLPQSVWLTILAMLSAILTWGIYKLPCWRVKS